MSLDTEGILSHRVVGESEAHLLELLDAEEGGEVEVAEHDLGCGLVGLPYQRAFDQALRPLQLNDVDDNRGQPPL